MNFKHLCLILIVLIAVSCNKKYQGNDLYPIDENGKMGYIDSLGNVIIKPQFDFAAPFSDELALVITDTTYGYIDTRGLYAIKPILSIRGLFFRPDFSNSFFDAIEQNYNSTKINAANDSLKYQRYLDHLKNMKNLHESEPPICSK